MGGDPFLIGTGFFVSLGTFWNNWRVIFFWEVCPFQQPQLLWPCSSDIYTSQSPGVKLWVWFISCAGPWVPRTGACGGSVEAPVEGDQNAPAKPPLPLCLRQTNGMKVSDWPCTHGHLPWHCETPLGAPRAALGALTVSGTVWSAYGACFLVWWQRWSLVSPVEPSAVQFVLFLCAGAWKAVILHPLLRGWDSLQVHTDWDWCCFSTSSPSPSVNGSAYSLNC